MTKRVVEYLNFRKIKYFDAYFRYINLSYIRSIFHINSTI